MKQQENKEHKANKRECKENTPFVRWSLTMLCTSERPSFAGLSLQTLGFACRDIVVVYNLFVLLPLLSLIILLLYQGTTLWM